MSSSRPMIFLDRFPAGTPADDILNIDKLIELTNGIIDFCDLQGVALYPVKKEVGGNAKKISKAAQTQDATTLDELLDREKKLGCAKRSSSGSSALLWLFRTVELIFAFLAGIVENPQADTHQVGRDAYSKTLMRYHHIAVRKIFYLGLGLFPSRTEFLRRLALDQPDLEDYVMERLSSFVKDYRRKLVPLCNILVEYGLEDARASNSPDEVTSRTEEEEAVVVR